MSGTYPAGAAGRSEGGQEGGQPSEEQIRAYLSQLREADATEIVAQAFSLLASGAEVKLGRRDARVLIDAAAALSDAVGEDIDGGVTEQMSNAVGKLRMAQVEAEGGQKEQTTSQTASQQPPGEQQPSAGSQQQTGRSGTSRLWTPGS